VAIKNLLLPAFVAALATAVPLVGAILFSQPVPSQAVAPVPARAPAYGDFGGPGNPYTSGVAAVDGHPSGGLIDQLPMTRGPASGYWDYNQSDLNGASRGFPPSELTVNQRLPAGSSDTDAT
jgi:hypothetical protein